MNDRYETDLLKRLAKIQVENRKLKEENKELRIRIGIEHASKNIELVEFISDFQEATTR